MAACQALIHENNALRDEVARLDGMAHGLQNGDLVPQSMLDSVLKERDNSVRKAQARAAMHSAANNALKELGRRVAVQTALRGVRNFKLNTAKESVEKELRQVC